MGNGTPQYPLFTKPGTLSLPPHSSLRTYRIRHGTVNAQHPPPRSARSPLSPSCSVMGLYGSSGFATQEKHLARYPWQILPNEPLTVISEFYDVVQRSPNHQKHPTATRQAHKRAEAAAYLMCYRNGKGTPYPGTIMGDRPDLGGVPQLLT